MKTISALPIPQLRENASEWLARSLAVLLVIGLPLAAFLLAPNRASSVEETIELHARMPEQGGWSLGSLTAKAGQPLHLRLVSDDVLHSFKVGRSDEAAIDLVPGKTIETTLTFDKPGSYTFYCTRWCGPDHWRMRGVIEVLPQPGSPAPTAQAEGPPLYQSLGLDIDAPHPAQVTPASLPSAARGAAINLALPPVYLSSIFYRTHSPAEVWDILRRDPLAKDLDDEQVWDLVAWIWSQNSAPLELETGKALYAQNCAACHGESGKGDGVFAAGPPLAGADVHPEMNIEGQLQQPPANFSDPARMLGASPAVLNGKITRGGMGTGMPYWGPVFTQAQIWDLVGYLYEFQFDLEVNP